METIPPLPKHPEPYTPVIPPTTYQQYHAELSYQHSCPIHNSPLDIYCYPIRFPFPWLSHSSALYLQSPIRHALSPLTLSYNPVSLPAHHSCQYILYSHRTAIAPSRPSYTSGYSFFLCQRR